jgi:hypothetical protein
VTEFIDGHGNLPASLSLSGKEVGIGSFYRALCRAFSALASGADSRSLKIEACPQLPALADPIALSTEADFAGWVIHPEDLDTRRLLELTRLQTWTLRPAALVL